MNEPKPSMSTPYWGKICIGVRMYKQVDDDFVFDWTNLLLRGLRKGDVAALSRGKPAHAAANENIRTFLTTECDTFLSLDSDASFTPDFLNVLRDYEPGWAFDALQAFHTRRGWPPEALWFKDGGDTMLQCMVTEEGTEEVGMIGTHCALFRREIFERIYEVHGKSQGIPLEEFDWHCYPRHKVMSDEATLSREARELGFRLGATTAVKVGHLSRVMTGWETYQEYLEFSGTKRRTNRFMELAELVAAYTGETKNQVMMKALDGGANVKKSWDARLPKNVAQVNAFYGASDSGYLYDLVYWNASEFYETIVAGLQAFSAQNVLVVGSGIGGEIAELRERNFVDVFELPGALREFCQKRFSDDTSVRFLTGDTLALALHGYGPFYETAVAVDVIEHIHPDVFDETMDTLGRVIALGGALYCHNNFGQQDVYPMHFDHTERFAAWCKRHGFSQESEFVWRKS